MFSVTGSREVLQIPSGLNEGCTLGQHNTTADFATQLLSLEADCY